MVSDEIERLLLASENDLREFTKLFAKKYEKLFGASGYSKTVLHSDVYDFFPYEVTLEIKKTKE